MTTVLAILALWLVIAIVVAIAFGHICHTDTGTCRCQDWENRR